MEECGLRWAVGLLFRRRGDGLRVVVAKGENQLFLKKKEKDDGWLKSTR